MSACLPTTSYKTHHENIDRYSLPRSRQNQPVGQRTNMSYTDHTIRYSDDDKESLSVTYITERIIAMLFPSGGLEATYKYHLDQVANMLQTKHANNCLVLNLSESKPEVSKLNTQVIEFGWPENLAPPLERVCSLCKVLDNWLMSNPQHVVVIHCRGEQGRMGLIVASYMHYTNICASADQALDRFAMKRFYDDKLSVLTQPSQRRYVNYFAGLLSGSIKINSNPLYLHHILIHGVPNFDTKGGCRPFIKVYEAMQPVFNSGVYNVTDNMQKVCISIQPGIPLRGDILIKCYHKKFRSGGREIVWRCQFHTCAISGHNVSLSKRELDDACYDPRFPETGKAELVFASSDKATSHISGFKSDITVPIDEMGDALQRWDSYENFADPNTDINGYVDNVSSTSGFHVNELSGNFKTMKYNERNEQQKSPVTSKEQSQLDEILRELLGEANYGSQSKTTTTKTYNYSSSEPDGGVRKEVHHTNYSSPGWSEHKVTTARTLRGEEVVSPEARSPPDRKPYIPRTAFTYTPGESEKTHERGPTSPKYSGYDTHAEERHSYSTSSAHKAQLSPDRDLTWLEIQQRKLRAKQGGRDDTRVRQEKQLVEELKNAQTQFTQTKRYPGSDTPDHAPLLVNGYAPGSQNFSTYQYSTLTRDGAVTPTYSTTSTLKQHEQDMVQDGYSTQWSETYSTTSGKPKQKPPPSPAQVSEKSPSVPATPQRSSSRDYMQQQQRSYNSEWQSHSRPLVRQQSDTSYNRQFSATQPKSSTPPPASPPRSFSPPPHQSSSSSYQTFNTTYNTRPEYKDTPGHTYRTEVFIHGNAPTTSQTVSEHKEDHSDTTHTLDELEKLLKSTSTDISSLQRSRPAPVVTKTMYVDPPAHPPQQQQQQQQQQQTETRYETWKTTQVQKFESQQAEAAAAPAPAPVVKKSTIVEEENIMLRPIGVHTLEPDDAGSTHTLSRTPTFIPPETPPFPVSPKTSYTNQVSAVSENFQYSQRGNVQHIDNQQGHVIHQTSPSFNPPIIINHAEPSQQQYHSTQTIQHEEPVVIVQQQSFAELQRHEQLHLQQQQLQEQQQLIKEQQLKEQQLKQQQIQQQQLLEQQQHIQKQHMIIKEQQIKEQQIKQQQIKQQQLEQQQQLAEQQQLEQVRIQQQQHELAEQQRQLQQKQQFQQQQLVQQQNQQQHQLQQDLQHQFQSEQQQQFYTTTTTETRQLGGQEQHVGGQEHRSFGSQQMSGTLPRALHVDTSRGYHHQSGGTLTRSPHSVSSPPSPGTVDRFRTQFNSAAVAGHHSGSMTLSPGAHSLTGQSSPSVYFGLSRRGSMTSLADFDVVNTTPKFVKDTSKFWYKPHITRDDAIVLLKDKAPGTFVVRDSNSFPGAFGLAVKVAQVPANVHTKPSGDPLSDLVRHFLIEPTPKGVRLKGCVNEPVFGSLAALVYQHSMTPLALPCKLSLPEADNSVVDGLLESPTSLEVSGSATSLLEQGAACNVLFLNTVDTESLTGPVAIAKALKVTLETDPPVKTTVVHFKVSSQGITLTDNQRKLFFRRHYPVAAVTYCGLDKDDRRWKHSEDGQGTLVNSKIFGFIARKQGGVSDNSCHLFAELDRDQPASAIVNFVSKVMMTHGKK